MAQRWGGWYWHFGLTSLLVMGGAINDSRDCALAQITPDGTLGAESSVVTPTNIDGRPTQRINGGATRGANLFHSFEQFSVPTGSAAYFNNALDIQNIISRVTGGSVSNINGLLQANGTANVFLLNPNGIVFGRNASLNIGGSFAATTANAIQFGNQGFFNASAPNNPPVLTVNPSAFLFNQIAAGSIANNSTAPAGLSPSGINVLGLRVSDGRSLLLVGDVSLNGGSLNALGGRVELGGLAGVGTVKLGIDGNTFSLGFTPDSLLSNVTLADDARVSVRGAGGGNIVVNANVFTATDGGRLVTGTEGLGNAGDITVNANNFSISGVGLSGIGAGLYNQTLVNASGNAGNIFVNTRSFNASSGAFLQNNVQAGSVGNGGNINITAGSLSVTNGAQLVAFTSGQGNAGNVTINAHDTVSFDGVGSNGLFGAAYSVVQAGAIGNGGNVTIKAGSLSLTDGAQVRAETYGQGDAGNVSIDVRDTVTLAGVNNEIVSGVFSSVQSGAIGNGGDINITAGGSLSLTDSALLVADTLGQGNAGDITIQTQSLTLINGGELGASVFREQDEIPGGQGEGGNIRVNASNFVNISGVGPGGFSSGMFTNTQRGALGPGGDIEINTGAFRIADGAVVTAQTLNPSDGGNITINANTFEAANGGQVLTGTFSSGRAGNITVNATDSITLSGSDPTFADRFNRFGRDIVANYGSASGVFANTDSNSTGQGGGLRIILDN